MLFRDFSMIAAISYAAMSAADFEPERMLWDELGQDKQNQYMQSALAVARGEPTDAGPVFEATAKAIFEYNNGQGLLALEELMNLGSTVMSLELLNEEDVADTNIRESIVGLLRELQERRQAPTGGLSTSQFDPVYEERERRTQALTIAVDRARSSEAAGKPVKESIVEAAQVFHDFLSGGGDYPWFRVNALRHATEVAGAGIRASSVVLVAEDLLTFLDPPTPAEPAVAEEPQVETVQ